MSAANPQIIVFASATAFVLFAGLLIYEWVLRYRLTLKERLREISTNADRTLTVSLFKDLKQIDTPSAFQHPSFIERMQHVIDQAGVDYSMSSLILTSSCLAVVLGGAAFLHAWWLAIVTVPIGLGAPLMVLLQYRRVRIRKLTRQLPEAFALISRAVRSGQTVQSALRIIAEDFDPPISNEFALCCEQHSLGMSRETAFRRLAARSDIMELQIFVVALLVQARSGGNLVELLDNLATLIRKRLSMSDRVRALTGEGRAQAMVLILLPIAVFVGLITCAPDYSHELLSRPWLLGATVVAQSLGALWIRRIVNIQY